MFARFCSFLDSDLMMKGEAAAGVLALHCITAGYAEFSHMNLEE